MSDQQLPEGTPLWASIMYDTQKEGFRMVYDRLDDLDGKVDPLVIWQAEHTTQHNVNDSRRNKVVAAVLGAGTLLGSIVGGVLGSTGK